MKMLRTLAMLDAMTLVHGDTTMAASVASRFMAFFDSGRRHAPWWWVAVTDRIEAAGRMAAEPEPQNACACGGGAAAPRLEVALACKGSCVAGDLD